MVVVERSQIGGDCPNRACVPTKALLASAARLRAARASEAFGVRANATFDWTTAIHRKERIVSEIVSHDEEVYRRAGVELVRGDARFVDELTVEVAGERIRGERAVVASGSRPRVPDIPGMRDSAITSEDAVELEKLPARVFILGGGVVGTEFAQLFTSAGTNVVLADRGTRLVDTEDPEVSEALAADLRARGVDLRLGTSVSEVRREDGLVCVVMEDGTEIATETVLAATGRDAAIAGLDLDRTGVRVTKRGVDADGTLRTSHERIWAAGDVLGGLLYTHVASYEGHLAGHNALAGEPRRVDRTGIPRITFADPPLAGVGPNEEDARKAGDDPVVARVELTGMGRALVDGFEGGMLAIVADRKTRHLLGASMWGPHADSVIQEIATLVRANGTTETLGEAIHAYPSYNEAISMAVAQLP